MNSTEDGPSVTRNVTVPAGNSTVQCRLAHKQVQYNVYTARAERAETCANSDLEFTTFRRGFDRAICPDVWWEGDAKHIIKMSSNETI